MNPDGRGRIGRQKSVASAESACGVRAHTGRVHKLSLHYRFPRNTLYACKTAKTNAVPTTGMLRRRLYVPGPRGSRYSRPQVLYVWRVINETRTALSTGRGLSRRRPPSAVPLRSSRLSSLPFIVRNKLADDGETALFFLHLRELHADQFHPGQMETVTRHFIF